MKKDPHRELPIRIKLEMAKDVAQIVQHLHQGQRSAADLLIEDLKTRSLFLSADVQQDVLAFAAQVQFQYDYDPWHRMTPEVQRAADQLLEDLGWFSRD